MSVENAGLDCAACCARSNSSDRDYESVEDKQTQEANMNFANSRDWSYFPYPVKSTRYCGISKTSCFPKCTSLHFESLARSHNLLSGKLEIERLKQVFKFSGPIV